MLFRLFPILLLLLPLHGALTVFGFEGIRYWKEVFLLGLGLYWFYKEGLSLVSKKSVQLKKLEIYSLLFIVWIGILVLLSPDKGIALQSARYLGMGGGVFFLVSRLLSFFNRDELTNLFQAAVRYFLYGCGISVLFGLWAQFLGGYEVLQSWYSNTISSWVPGQNIPLYHETGGLIRMQGTSSGPVEFAHILLLGVMVLPFASFKKQVCRGVFFLLLLGIIFSLTRAVWIGLLVYGGIVLWQRYKWSLKQIVLPVIAGGLVLVATILFIPQIKQQLVERSGTSDHITRPIEVFKLGLKNPIVGEIGIAGPAARAKNLRENNDDKAPIAENIFVDYFAQTGVIGLVLILCFWWNLLKMKKEEFLRVVIPFFITANMATIFDMTPLSISFFIILAFLAHISIIDPNKA